MFCMKTINQAEIINANNVNESSLECLPVSVFMKEQKLLITVRNSLWCFVKLYVEHFSSFPSPWNTCMLPGSCRWEEAMVCVSIHCCSYSVWSGICPLGTAQTEGFQIWLWHMHSGLFHYTTHVMQGRVSGESILKTFWLLLNYCLLSRSHVLSVCLLQAAELEDTAHMLQNRIHSDRLDQWLRKIGYS